jgi:hypothetical protein
MASAIPAEGPEAVKSSNGFVSVVNCIIGPGLVIKRISVVVEQFMRPFFLDEEPVAEEVNG